MPLPFRLRSRSFLTLFLVVSASPGALSPRRAFATEGAPRPPGPPPIELREIVWGGRHGQMRHQQVPFQGGVLLEGAAFYRAVNHDDLARVYESRVQVKRLLEWGGFAALIAGAFTLKATQSEGPQSGGTGIGIAITLLGPVLMLTGAVMDPHPVSFDERRHLIDSFNASTTDPASPSEPPKVSLGAGPLVSPDGAGLVVHGQF